MAVAMASTSSLLLALLIACFIYTVSAASASANPKIVHFTLSRRGGPFSHNRTADLDLLTEQVHIAEGRFNRTQREVRGNKIVRAPKERVVGSGEEARLLGEIGRDGSWFAQWLLGSVNQPIDMDLDMLTADFVVTSTSSSRGTNFQEFFSKTYQPNSLTHPFPYCSLPRDGLILPGVHQRFPLTFPHCKPSKQSRETLGDSGGLLGLAPSDSLKQMDVSSLMKQLLEAGIIEEEVFSITLINSWQGVLSVGGTASQSMDMIEDRIEKFLGKSTPPAAEEVHDAEQDAMDRANGDFPEFVPVTDVDDQTSDGPPPQADAEAQYNAHRDAVMQGQNRGILKRGLDAIADFTLSKRARKARPLDPKGMPGWREQWKWSPVEGADGWWQTLLRGVWVDGTKVLKNQPCVLDVNVPFVLAPPQAAKQFYQAISGSRRLPEPYSRFYAFPCNNPPFINVEFGGWKFPAMRGMKSYDQSNGPNGKFSLGKVTDESGYCVGAVVETKMGVGDLSPVKKGAQRKDALGPQDSGALAGNGMRDVWVLGEPIFRGLGMVFDVKHKQIGFRTY